MKIIHQQLGNIQFDHTRWSDELTFAKKEIITYEKQLMILIGRYSKDEEKKKRLEDLLNGFRLQEEEIELIEAQIRDHDTQIKHLVNYNGELKAMLNTYHSATKDQLIIFRKKFTEQKAEFDRFFTLQN